MQRQGGLIRSVVEWFGLFRFLLLVLVVVAVAGGFLWERQRRPPVPPGARNVASDINVGDIRQTTFRVPGTAADVRAFYQQAMPQRGWRYCGTQATPRCSNMPQAGGSEQQIEVYRQANDQNYRGSTIEVWPVRSEGGETYVTIFETRSR
jgi:hypothetical protein